MRVPREGVSGVECPECGSIRTKVRNSGRTDEGHRLRKRKCLDCDAAMFCTVEVAVPFPFYKLDSTTAMRDRIYQRKKFGHLPRKGYMLPPKIHLTVNVVGKESKFTKYDS